MTTSPICYLAHPIDFQKGLAPNNADYVRQGLRDAGFVVYSPAKAFTAPALATPGPELQRVNLATLERCHALVAMYPEDRTIGVPMEMDVAQRSGKPVLVITRGETRSWTLAEFGERPGVRISRYPGKGNLFGWLYDQTRSWTEPLTTPLSVRLDESGARLPTRSYTGDAGFDLYTIGDHLIEPGEFVDVPVGCSVQLPDGVWGLLIGRSSTLRKHELMVNPGVIDTGYRGPLYAGVRNLGPQVFEAKDGMRLAQLIPLPNLAPQLYPVQVAELDITDRQNLGFGSSGE